MGNKGAKERERRGGGEEERRWSTRAAFPGSLKL